MPLLLVAGAAGLVGLLWVERLVARFHAPAETYALRPPRPPRPRRGERRGERRGGLGGGA